MTAQIANRPSRSKDRVPEETPYVPMRPMPRLEQPLALTCGACGVTAGYQVGTVLADADLGNGTREEVEACIGFTALFRCRGCGAGGPWAISNASFGTLARLLAAKMRGEVGVPLEFAGLAMSDGFGYRYPSQAEDHLLKLLKTSPEDADLWVRLGNIYGHAGQPSGAEATFVRALELDPDNLEARGGYARALKELGREMEAVPHWHYLLRHIREAKRLPRAQREGMVLGAIFSLVDAHQLSKGAFELFPKEFIPEMYADGEDGPWGKVRDFRGSSPRDMRALCDIFLGERRGVLGALVGRWRGRREPLDTESQPSLTVHRLPRIEVGKPLGAQLQPAVPTARNATCPCGSGHKYKKCCGK